VLAHAFPEYQIANVSIQVKDFFDRLGAEFTGIGAACGLDFARLRGREDPLALLKPATLDHFGRFEGYDQTAPAFEQVEVGAALARLGLRAGVVLFRFQDAPMFVCCSRQDTMHDEYRFTVVARDVTRAQRLLAAFLEHERAHSIFRGRLIRPEIDYGDRVTEAEILPFADVRWEQVVLPDALRQRIARDVLEYVHAARALIANDVEPRRSILFHGPPGTGKTFVCKLLATELRGFTSVLITGENLLRPEAAFALARSLAPALLFFEDVDLVARDRDGTRSPTALSGLLNELDGLPRSERIYVVFTTNRLDVLEEALAQRPGRVDVIVGFPLPEAPLRQRLVRLYAGKAAVDQAEVDWVVERTDGVTPAFLREFMKEAVFTAIRAGAVDGHGIATVGRTHLTETFDRFAEIRREHGADRILGFRHDQWRGIDRTDVARPGKSGDPREVEAPWSRQEVEQ
jgi:AAA+ superfamily predicted ATPase